MVEDEDAGVTSSIIGSMHERKALMFDLRTGRGVAGRVGTLEELFEILPWL
ncbi:MAG: LOG family protein [Actinomycetota bacterium]|nr:LOG family protein [Actinomycetota bacterium]